MDVQFRPSSGATRFLSISRDNQPCSFRDVLTGWRDDPASSDAFCAALAALPFPALRLELPPLTAATIDDPIGGVVIEDRWLDGPTADASAFQEHFSEAPVVWFPNLGRDATLLAPRPVGPPEHYPHLVAFARGAPQDQRRAFWAAAAERALASIGEAPVWVSTAGAGIPWLHLRLDTAPKYYRHVPYRAAPR